MNKNAKFALSFLITALFIVLSAAAQVSAERLKGKAYYTRVNIWYESPKKIPSSNYHKGTLLPVGTKVRMISMGNRKIIFRPKGSEEDFVIVQQRKHSIITLKALFDRYFSKKDPMAPGSEFHQYTTLEQKNIEAGNVVIGMRRNAVLMAYGYPPSHKTPNLGNNVWHYWYARIHQVTIHFKRDNVSKIETVLALPGHRNREISSTDEILEGPRKKRFKGTQE